MRRFAGWCCGALIALAAQAQEPSAAAPEAVGSTASRLERWSWNPRERTARGIARQEAGDAAGAAAALDVAHRLAPESPTSAFNAGTARLGAGRPDALPPLEQAAREADPALAPDAWYNLGNARLAGRDARGAIEAYVETLRRAPERADAKHNLELALRELERQQQQQREQEEKQRQSDSKSQPSEPREQDGQKGSESAPSKSQDGEGSEPEPEPEPRPGTEKASDEQDQESEGGAGGQRPEPPPPGSRPEDDPDRSSRLPRFRDVPEMNAEQAAALLAAVENLERQARRERAAARTRERAEVDDDW